MRTLTRLLSILALLGALGAPAQAAFVTDKLLAGLYPEAKVEGDPLKVLPSGTPVEVLQQQEGFVKVRLGDRTEGWIESGYLTDEKPARVMLLEQQARANTLQQALRQAEDELKAAQEQLAEKESPVADDPALGELREQNANLQKQVETLQRVLEQKPAENSDSALRQERDRLAAQLEAVRSALGVASQSGGISEPVKEAESAATPPLGAWYLPLLGAMLVVGFIAGIAFKNYRIAKRYGGFRI